MSKIKNIKWEKGFLRIWAIGSSGWFILAMWTYFDEKRRYSDSTLYTPDISNFLVPGLVYPIGILIFAYAAKFLIKFIIQGFK